MLEFELSDNADAVVRVVIAIGKLLILVFVICMLWECRTPTQSLFRADKDLQPRKQAEQIAEVDFGQFDNHFWLPGPDSTGRLYVFLEDGELTGENAPPSAQDDGTGTGEDESSADSSNKETA